MVSLDTPQGRARLLIAVVLTCLGSILLLASAVAVAGLWVEGRFTWARANPALAVLLVSAFITGGGVTLYCQIERGPRPAA